MNTPLVSIIIPTYNRAHLIGETLDSIVAQTYENWECIIVDDGSTDNTEEIVNKYIKKDNRFQYHLRPAHHKSGGNGARNYGFFLSKGKYINFFDSDDVMLPNKMEIIIKELQKETAEACVVKSGYYNFNTNELISYWKKGNLFSNNLLEDFVCQNIGWQTGDCVMRREKVKSKFFNEQLLSSQDWEAFVLFLIKKPNIVFVDKCLTKLRISNDAIHVNKNFKKINSDFLSRKSVVSNLKKEKLLSKSISRKIILTYFNYLDYFILNNYKLKTLQCYKEIIILTLYSSSYNLYFRKSLLIIIKAVKKINNSFSL